MKQRFIPAPGKIVVVREKAEQKIRYGSLELERHPDDIEYETVANPWALVVGVGKPETLQNGQLLTTEYEEGDKVAVVQVGINLPLKTSDGKVDYIYVLPFDGVTGRVEAVCEKCQFVERKSEAVMTLECPQCGDKPAPPPMICTPTLPQVSELTGLK